MMKIIFTVASMAGGGAERVISILANRLIQEKNQITIIMIAGDKVDYQLNPKIKVLSIGGITSGSMRKRFERIKKLHLLFKESEDAVIISFGLGSNFYTAVAHFRLRNPFIISERNDPSMCSYPHLRNLVFRCADKLVFQTVDAIQCFPKSIQKKGVVIPNPIENDICVAYAGKRKKRVVAVGRLEPQKNYPLLLKAFDLFHKEYIDYTLHLYGQGYLAEELQKLVYDMGLSEYVVFEGFCKNVHEKIVDSSMYVLSSDYEGISNALLEAMSLGLPVISTDCPIGGSKLCIQNGKNGILVSVGSIEELAQAMCRLAGNEEWASGLGREAMKVREYFSVEKITEKWKIILMQLQ